MIVTTAFAAWKFHKVQTASHGLRTPREKIAFTARPKIHSHSQIVWYGGSIFCLPHRPNFSDIYDLCLHWVSVVRGKNDWLRQELFNRWGICTQSHYSLYTNLDKDAQQEFSQEFETFTETLSQNRRIFIGRRNFNFWACIFRLVLKSFF